MIELPAPLADPAARPLARRQVAGARAGAPRSTARGRCRGTSSRGSARSGCPSQHGGAHRQLDRGRSRAGCPSIGEDRAGRPQARLDRVLAALPAQRSPDLRVWWAATDAPEEYEDALVDAFAAGVPATPSGPRSPATAMALPWAVLRTPSGIRKPTGIANPLLPEVKAPGAASRCTRIVDLPPGEADGARDEAKRARRPAPGRGVGRIASAAAYRRPGLPAQGARSRSSSRPRAWRGWRRSCTPCVAQRPEVIRRIATAREHGDLKENAEYHAAREEQGFLEGRIKSIEAKLKVAVVVAPTERGAIVELGSQRPGLR